MPYTLMLSNKNNGITDLPLSKVLDHQVAADEKRDFLSNFLYILIIFKWQIHKDDLCKFNFCSEMSI